RSRKQADESQIGSLARSTIPVAMAGSSRNSKSAIPECERTAQARITHGGCNPSRTSPRDGSALRRLRKDPRPASMVGLVCALPERASERQQSGGSRRRRQELHE